MSVSTITLTPPPIILTDTGNNLVRIISSVTESYSSNGGILLEPIGGADAVWVNGWNEFAYGTLPVLDDGQKPLNAVLDSIVRKKDPDKWEADFLHVLRDDLPRTNARKVVLWYQWFTYKDNLGAAAPLVSYTSSEFLRSDPDIFTVDTSHASGPRWNIDGTDGGTTVNVGPNILIQPGGTVADIAMVQGIRELVSRGYEVGICPVVNFYDPAGFATDQYFYWRGLNEWGNLTIFNAWLADYKLLHKHCIKLMQLAECDPWIAYSGSEMRWLAADAPPDIMSAWFIALADIADLWKAAFPNCKITYSASDYEAGYYKGTYAMDALWSADTTDFIGYSWYKPLAIKHTNDFGKLRAGVLAGERVDYYTDYNSMEGGRLLSGSDGQGKTSYPLIAMSSKESWQNGAVAWKLAHYSNKRDGIVAATSPLVGHNATMCDGISSNKLIFADLSGNAVLSRTTNTKRNLGPGVLKPPHEQDYFLQCNGTTSATTKMPSVVNFPVTSYSLRFVFKHYTATNDYARIARMQHGGTFDTLWDIQINRVNPNAVYLTFSVKDTSGGSHYYIFDTVNESNPEVTTVDIEVTATNVRVNGVDHSQATPPVMPTAGADLFFGAYSNAFANEQVDFYFARTEFFTDTPNRKYGGQWFFEDEYGGVRSPWVPLSKPPMASELGFASINGSCVEPNVFPEVRRSNDPLPHPTWFHDYGYWSGRGISDIVGPVGSTFNEDEYHQAVCMSAACGALKEAGFAHIVAYNLDARPSASIQAKDNNGQYYFGDAPNYRISHALNGKLAGGMYKEIVEFQTVTPIPDPISSTGLTNIYYVRHADTARDVSGYYIRDFTANGDAQVAALPAKLDALGVEFDIIICSPTWRTMNTIVGWLDANERTAEIWPELSESSWTTVGEETNKIEGGLVIQMFHEKMFEHRHHGWGTMSEDIPYPARIYGETVQSGFNMVKFANDLIRHRFSGKGVNVLIIGHYHAGARMLTMLQGGDTTTYDPVNPPYQLSNAKVNKLVEDGAHYRLDILNDQPVYNGSLVGSNAVHIGDSISTDRSWVKWPDGTRNGTYDTRMRYASMNNVSAGGRTLKTAAPDWETTDFTGVDICTIFLGTNDWGGGLNLGLISDAPDIDVYSFYANYKYTIEGLQAKNPTMEIVLFTPLQRENHTVPSPAGHILEQFVNAIFALGTLYSLPVVDLFNGNVLYWNSALDETTSLYTYDGLHPEWDSPGETEAITEPVMAFFFTNYP